MQFVVDNQNNNMALRTFVKVNGVNNLSDARYCAGMSVDQLGFNIEPEHANYTDAKAFNEISDWLSGVAYVAEIESENTAINEAISGYNVQAIQIENESQLDAATETGLSVIFKVDSLSNGQYIWNLYQDKLAYILVDLSESKLDELETQEYPMVVQGQIDDTNVDSLLENLEPKGIALVGGNEIRPGFKDFDALADILEALEIDDLD